MTQGSEAYVQMVSLPPLKVGAIYARKGVPHIFRVIAENNWVQRFSGNRHERLTKLLEWRKAKVWKQ